MVQCFAHITARRGMQRPEFTEGKSHGYEAAPAEGRLSEAGDPSTSSGRRFIAGRARQFASQHLDM